MDTEGRPRPADLRADARFPDPTLRVGVRVGPRTASRGPLTYDTNVDATPTIAADERIHLEAARALATRGRNQLSGSFRAAVFSANDGLVSNLALILGISATGVTSYTVLATGLAGLPAGALSMGAGEYVSGNSQRELLEASTPSPEAGAALPQLDVKANELALVDRARGMSVDDATSHAAKVLDNLATGGRSQLAGPDADRHEAVGTGLRRRFPASASSRRGH